MGNKSVLIFGVLCALFTTSVLISEVNAKSTRHVSSNHGHHNSGAQHHLTSSSGHKLSGGSSGYPKLHTSASYPAAKPNSLSGTSSGYETSHMMSSSARQLNSAPHPSATTQSLGYPSPRPGSYSGVSNSVNPPAANIAVPNNYGAIGASYPSPGLGYPTTRPGSYSGINSPGQNSMANNINSGSKPHSYPSSPSNSLSGGGSKTQYTSGGTTYHQNSYSNDHNSNWGSNHNTHYVSHHHHYIYKPPTVIHYGAQSVTYPVYTGQLPTYVYEYRSSKNKYSHLLAGLALYNLGRVSGTTDSYRFHERYNPQPNEYCTFIVEERGRFDEMAIDCRAISYFIFEDEPRTQVYNTLNVLNQTTVTTQMLLPNGTLMSSAVQSPSNINVQPNPTIGQAPQQNLMPNGQLMPNVQQTNMATTTTQVSFVSSSQFNGQHVQLNPDMKCYVTRKVTFSAGMKKQVSCDLLQTYSVKSLRNSAVLKKASFVFILQAFAFLLLFMF